MSVVEKSPTLLCFKDIRQNNYHAKTTKENGMEYFCITSYLYDQKHILEKMERLPNGLYIRTIHSIEANYVTGQNLVVSSTYLLWYDYLGHPGQDRMCRILKSSHEHPFLVRTLCIATQFAMHAR